MNTNIIKTLIIVFRNVSSILKFKFYPDVNTAWIKICNNYSNERLSNFAIVRGRWLRRRRLGGGGRCEWRAGGGRAKVGGVDARRDAANWCVWGSQILFTLISCNSLCSLVISSWVTIYWLRFNLLNLHKYLWQLYVSCQCRKQIFATTLAIANTFTGCRGARRRFVLTCQVLEKILSWLRVQQSWNRFCLHQLSAEANQNCKVDCKKSHRQGCLWLQENANWVQRKLKKSWS